MSSHYLFHSQASEKVPFNAKYTFPSQATRVSKSVVKIPAKNGEPFLPNRAPIRIELPADGYLDPLESYLAFNVNITYKLGAQPALAIPKDKWCHLTKNAQTVFSRQRLLYGSLTIEDIQDADCLVRMLTEAGVGQDYARSSGSVLENIFASSVRECHGTTANPETSDLFSPAEDTARPDIGKANDVAAWNIIYHGSNSSADFAVTLTRRFCVSPILGLLCQKKLIPLKWLASQIALEFTINDPNNCLIRPITWTSDLPTLYIDNVVYVAQLLEFDSSYDSAFYAGLQETGVPLLFSSWHRHTYTLSGPVFTQQIHERSRSVKSAFAVVRQQTRTNPNVDNYHFLANLKVDPSIDPQTLDFKDGLIEQYQWRVGGRYYPSQPVECRYGGAEAYMELLKALNVVGDYSTGCAIDYATWSFPDRGAAEDWHLSYAGGETPGNPYNTNALWGTKFIMACEFESSNGFEISGLNAEEQSDLMLTFKAPSYPAATVTVDDITSPNPAFSKKVDIFVYFDAMIIVRPGNVVDLIM